MNRITSGQLTCALLLSNAFMLMCMSAPIGAESMLGAVLSFAVQLIICIPMLLLRKYDFSLGNYCSAHHYFLPCLYILYFYFRGGYSFVLIWKGSEQLSLPFSSSLVTAILIGVVCLYTASLGLKAFARSAGVVFGFLIIAAVILILGAWQRVDVKNVQLTEDCTVIGSALRYLSMADTLPVFFVLECFTKQPKIPKNAGFLTKAKLNLRNIRFIPLSLALWELVLFLSITVLGSLVNSSGYPFFMLTSVSQPLDTQRADAFYLVLFVLLCIIRLTLLTVLSAHLLGMIFPRLKLRSIISLVFMIAAAVAFKALDMGGNLFCIVSILFFGGILPLYLFLSNRIISKGKENAS